jgi:sirohydrochlorin ferrochelatase
MTAPSLILLGHGSHDPQVPQASHQIRDGLLAIRPELDIHVAFLDHCAPSGVQIVTKLVRQGIKEIVFVPLLLSDAFNVHADVPALLAQVRASFP